MIRVFSLLLLYQLAGETLVRIVKLPVPGPVAGMLLLLSVLLVRSRVGEEFQQGTGMLLQHLSLFFVPAGVGIIAHLPRIANEWLPIMLAVFISTFAGMAVTVWVLKALICKRAEGRPS